MKYTSKQLLGAIIKYSAEYTVVKNERDVQLQSNENKKMFFSAYNTKKINDDLKHKQCTIISMINNNSSYEIYF